MAITTTISRNELARVAALCYEGKYARISLALLTSQGYTVESTRSDWDSIKISGNGYQDYWAPILTGAYDSGDNRHETPEITAEFTATGTGYSYSTIYVIIAEPSTFDITNTSLTDNVATITTDGAHGFTAGKTVVIAGADNSVYNGAYTIATTPASNTFTFSKTNANLGSVSSAGTASEMTQETYLHSIITESPAIVLSPSQSVSYKIQFCTDD